MDVPGWSARDWKSLAEAEKRPQALGIWRFYPQLTPLPPPMQAHKAPESATMPIVHRSSFIIHHLSVHHSSLLSAKLDVT
jgi:hypothetical protein